MAKNKAKKQKLTRPTEAISIRNTKKVVKKLRKNKKPKAEKPLPPIPVPSTDDSSDEGFSESDPETIQKLLEPYTKDQLIDILVDAACADSSISSRIRSAADRDISHRKIFVFGLGWDATRESVAAVFSPYGEIDECHVVTDRATGKAKGFGFVVFKTRKGASRALKEPRKKINNRMTSCQLASLGPAPFPDTSNRKIYVTNVATDVDPEKLRAFFAKFGEIEMGPMGFDLQTGKSRGFALFVYKNYEGARKALEEPDKMFDGHHLHCRKAIENKNKGVASITTGVQQIPSPAMAAVAPTPNLGLLSQYPAMYGGYFVNPVSGYLPVQMNPLLAAGGNASAGFGLGNVKTGLDVGDEALGIGGYNRMGGLGSSNESVLGSYDGSPSSSVKDMNLQLGYLNSSSNSLVAKNLAANPQGSFGGYHSFF